MIEISHLQKQFGGIPVLRDIDLIIPDGHIMVIAGGSGCGKTVLLRSIIGLIQPDSGAIHVNGEDVTQMTRNQLFEIRKQFGMLFQSAALFDSLSVADNIGLALYEHTRMTESEIADRVKEKLALVGLNGAEDKKPAALSGGMKKRVGLARALIMDPKYVLFDEPTTGLDPITADAINRLILDTQQQLGITAVVVTHDMHSAFRIGDRVAMIHDGRVVFSGSPEAFRKSDHPYVRQFNDSSKIDNRT